MAFGGQESMKDCVTVFHRGIFGHRLGLVVKEVWR